MSHFVYKYLDTREANKDGLYPVKVALSKDRKTEYISTGYSVSQNDYDLLNTSRVPKHLIKVGEEIDEVETYIKNLVKSYKYDIKKFRLLVKAHRKHRESKDLTLIPDIFSWFDLKIKECLDQFNAIGTAEVYRASKHFYQTYSGIEAAEFSYFTPKLLYEIQREALKKMSLSTIFKHARNMRAVFNMAIADKVITSEIYPFNKRGYHIGNPAKKKSALTRGEVKKLLSYKPTSKQEQKALDYFTFSYYANGMNIKDVAYLKPSDIYGPVIKFYRKKTERTVSEPMLITVAMTPEIQDIINRQRSQRSKWLFPILTTDTLEDQRKEYMNFDRLINKYLKKICVTIKIKKVTHGVSRSSYSTALLREGTEISYISKSMGHSSVAVTEHYLSGYENTEVVRQAEKLRRYSS